jgi:hypothetical protein
VERACLLRGCPTDGDHSMRTAGVKQIGVEVAAPKQVVRGDPEGCASQKRSGFERRSPGLAPPLVRTPRVRNDEDGNRIGRVVGRHAVKLKFPLNHEHDALVWAKPPVRQGILAIEVGRQQDLRANRDEAALHGLAAEIERDRDPLVAQGPFEHEAISVRAHLAIAAQPKSRALPAHLRIAAVPSCPWEILIRWSYISRNGSSAPSLALCDLKFESVTPTSRTPLVKIL